VLERSNPGLNDNNNNHNTTDEEIEIDLRELLRIFKKWSKPIIIMTLLCAFAAGLLSYFVMSPIYQAKTLLMVTQATEKLQTNPTRSGEGLEDVVNSVSRMPVLTMSTYLGQIKSETLMNRIIERLQLDPAKYNAFTIAGMIDATVVKDSNLIEVKVTSADPAVAAKIANVLSDEYLKLMTEKNQEQMSRSVEFLEKQKTLTDKDLDKASDYLKEFQSQPRGVAVLETEFNARSQDAATLNSRLKTVQIEIQQLAAGVYSLENQLVITPQTINSNKWDEDQGKAYSTQEANPVYVSLVQELIGKKATLAEKEGEAAGLQQMLAQTNLELDILQAELADKRMQEDKLQREVDRLNKTSETLAMKKTETQIAKSIDLGDTSVMVVSEASLPNAPIKPNKKLNIAIALVLGFMVFTLLAFVLEHMDNTLKTPEDINRELGLSVIGVIPKMTRQNTHYAQYGG
jgi:succinoglycan biosynthesis transport protein ExoP